MNPTTELSIQSKEESIAEIFGSIAGAMEHAVLVESDSSSDTDDQTKVWESDPRSVTAHLAHDSAHAALPAECGIGHRVQASRSVLALVLDNECVFAGLQGGDIVVRGTLTPQDSTH